MNSYLFRFKINLISRICCHNIRKTTTTSLIYNKMKTVVFSKFHYFMSPILSINEFTKINGFLCNCCFISRFNRTFIKLFHTSIIKEIIMSTSYSNIYNSTICFHTTWCSKTMLSTKFFSLSKLTMWNTIFLKSCIFTFILMKSSSSFCK